MTVKCEGMMPYECDMQAIFLVDSSETWDDVPTWLETVPMCDSCASNAHRGGFVNAKPITAEGQANETNEAW